MRLSELGLEPNSPPRPVVLPLGKPGPGPAPALQLSIQWLKAAPKKPDPFDQAEARAAAALGNREARGTAAGATATATAAHSVGPTQLAASGQRVAAQQKASLQHQQQGVAGEPASSVAKPPPGWLPSSVPSDRSAASSSLTSLRNTPAAGTTLEPLRGGPGTEQQQAASAALSTSAPPSPVRPRAATGAAALFKEPSFHRRAGSAGHVQLREGSAALSAAAAAAAAAAAGGGGGTAGRGTGAGEGASEPSQLAQGGVAALAMSPLEKAAMSEGAGAGVGPGGEGRLSHLRKLAGQGRAVQFQAASGAVSFVRGSRPVGAWVCC